MYFVQISDCVNISRYFEIVMCMGATVVFVLNCKALFTLTGNQCTERLVKVTVTVNLTLQEIDQGDA